MPLGERLTNTITMKKLKRFIIRCMSIPHYQLFFERKKNQISRWGGLLLALLFLNVTMSFAQANPNEAEWNGYGYSLKKIVSNLSIQSGVNFSYTILFTAPAGATTVTIEDLVPASLAIVSVPVPSPVSGVTPAVTITGQTVNYSLTGLPTGVAHSGSFTIVVKFPEGTTCDGETARNRAGILVNDKWEYTPYVSTVAVTVDPWKISKAILTGAVVNPSGGACGYLMNEGDTVKYRLSVLKNSPYWGNVIGQQNMSSAVVTDILPAGAVMTGSSANVGSASQAGSTITWTIGNLNAATAYAYYYCDIEVYYPAGTFPNGTTINNDATLTGTTCGQQATHNSNQTCIEVANIVQNPSGYFKKYLSLTDRVPGCQGYYNIVFCNNGNVALSAFNINDVIPSGISVSQVKVYGGDATTTMALSANSGGNVISSSISTNYFDSGLIAFTVNDLQLQMTGSLPVGDCINLLVYFDVDPNPTGTVVTNCSTFDGLSNSLTLAQTCVSFTVEEGQPKPCLNKDICSPMASYEPGDIVRFRLRVQNIGSADLIGGAISDVLHSNFSYVGNETYYVGSSYNPACSSSGTLPSGTSTWSGVSSSHSGNNLSWSIPDVPADCQLFYVGYCSYYGTYGLPYYFIEFDAEVDSFALPGVTPNEFEINGGNLSSTVASNEVNVLVVASFGQEVEKLVSVDNGSNYAASGTVGPGANARYRLSYKNTSNVPVSSLNLVDLLPRDDGTNDWLILNRTAPRGSQFDVAYAANHGTSLIPAATAPVPAIDFAAGQNICLPAMGVSVGCTSTSWSTTPDQNIRMDYSTFSLAPSLKLLEDFDVTIPAGVNNQQTVCNDFAALATADFLLDGTATTVSLTPIAAPPVCLTVDTTIVAENCCDSVTITQVQDDCCIRLSSKCEVKSIEVDVNYGTISSANWNCGTLPSGFVGQSNFTFTPNNCALELSACFDGDQSGPLSVIFTITFANGEVCEKEIDLDCAPADCCESVKIEKKQDECCATLTTDCEVESIEVTVDNGVISSAAWNCGALPAGFVGQNNYTFSANACVPDMTVCVSATQTGVVTITYNVTFVNGETCEKSIVMDCKASECCEAIKLEKVEGDGCCTRLVNSCEVDSVHVSVLNGSLSSASWNCGTIAGSYIGQSDFTFVSASPCAADLTTCVNATQGVVTTIYVVYLSNGDVCERSIETDCPVISVTCCAEVDFKLKPKWPHWNNMNGTFNISNLDPASPICSVEINATPAASFSTGSLTVDGVASGQAWTSAMIPASGVLSPAAVNDIVFNMSAVGYKGVIEICVVKCDGTRCCFEFKWNKKPWIDIGVEVGDVQLPGKLGVVTLNPVVDDQFEGKVKYVSFGFVDETEIADNQAEYFAITGINSDDEDKPESQASIISSCMGKNTAFFELSEAKSASEELGNFNLVIANHMPKLGCILFDEDGNLVVASEIDVKGDTLSTSVMAIGQLEDMFNFINLYPNPTHGNFNITFATGNRGKVDIKVIDNTGQLVLQKNGAGGYPGVHKESLTERNLISGIYHVILVDERGRTRSKSYVKE